VGRMPERTRLRLEVGFDTGSFAWEMALVIVRDGKWSSSAGTAVRSGKKNYRKHSHRVLTG
jgi:hypothetical protein